MSTSTPLMNRAARWAAPLGLAAVILTGCTGEADSGPAAAASLATPTQITRPADDQSCTVEVTTSESAEHPDRAAVTCGETVGEVAGDFRHQVTNRFDPAATGGIERVLVVGEEARVWMQHPEGTCLIVWQDGDDPVTCEVPGADHQDEGADEALSREALAEQEA